jgi:von Willebrand factor type A domain
MLTFLSPAGALAVLLALIPLAPAALAVRRSERAARALRLVPAPRRSAALPAALAAAACVCVGIAAAQPAWRTKERQPVRSQSQVMYVVDVSRSMAAAPNEAAPTRLARARTVVRQIHDAVPDVPSGLAGLTDRVLPYVFPTANRSVFDETLNRSVLVEAPKPQEVSTNATSFGALPQVVQNGFFDPGTKTRTCVLVTDGETRSYTSTGQPLGCRLVVVRVGGEGERVFGADGVPEPGYAPDPAAAAKVRALAEAVGGRAFDASEVAGAAGAVRADAEVGPVVHASEQTTLRPLAIWFSALALVLTVAFALLRFLPAVQRLVYTA